MLNMASVDGCKYTYYKYNRLRAMYCAGIPKLHSLNGVCKSDLVNT